jgi:hypothetical protein
VLYDKFDNYFMLRKIGILQTFGCIEKFKTFKRKEKSKKKFKLPARSMTFTLGDQSEFCPVSTLGL